MTRNQREPFEEALIKLMGDYADHASLDEIATALELQLLALRQREHADAEKAEMLTEGK
jgi:hypothetical protein